LNGQTAKQYLEESLKSEPIKNREAADTNFIRESIKNSFKSLDCFCLPLPITNGLYEKTHQELLQKIDKVDFKDLKDDFRTNIAKLCNSMKENISPKCLCTAFSGPVFSKYIEMLLDS
jgi:hypothetical protein